MQEQSADWSSQTAMHHDRQDGALLHCTTEAPVDSKDLHSSLCAPREPEYEAPVTVAEVGLPSVRARLPKAGEQPPDVQTLAAEHKAEERKVWFIQLHLCSLRMRHVWQCLPVTRRAVGIPRILGPSRTAGPSLVS
jgi:hypothetical protein